MNDLFTKGYLVGDVYKDIVKDQSQFNSVIDKLFKMSEDKSVYYGYRYAVKSPNGEQFIGMDDQIPVSEIQERHKFVAEKNAKVAQRWYELRNPSAEMYEILTYFRTLVSNFIPTLYPELSDANISYDDSISIYEDGDFIEPHTDGQNKGRLGVILIYLTKPSEYKDGGGKLIVTNNSITEEVIPVRGNYTILDFTNNNVQHAVQPVKNGFKRFCYISFIYNKDKK